MVVSRGNRLHEPHPPDVSLVRDEGVVSSSTSRPEESPTIPTPTSPPSSAPSSLPLTPTAPSSSLFPMPNADFYEGQEVDFRNAWRTFSDPSVPHLRNPFTNPFQTRLRSHPRYTCEVCNIVFSRAADTATHLKSSLHRRNVQLLLLEEMRTVTPVEDGGDDAAMATVKEEEKRRDLISRESQDLIEDAVGGGGDDTDRRTTFSSFEGQLETTTTSLPHPTYPTTSAAAAPLSLSRGIIQQQGLHFGYGGGSGRFVPGTAVGDGHLVGMVFGKRRRPDRFTHDRGFARPEYTMEISDDSGE